MKSARWLVEKNSQEREGRGGESGGLTLVNAGGLVGYFSGLFFGILPLFPRHSPVVLSLFPSLFLRYSYVILTLFLRYSSVIPFVFLTEE
jgi:hypothetical protein